MSDEKKYLSLSDDIEDFKNGYDGMEKAKAGFKILGKSIFNIGKYTVTEALPEMARRVEEENSKRGKN